jgi:hypothetical protein
MYFPYLRARQFELISLRELSAEPQFKSHVIPVLEPVRESVNGLILANKIFTENSFNPFLIVNPLQGEMAGETNMASQSSSMVCGGTGATPATS